MADGNTVTLELGGQTRRLKYDLNAIAEIGERLGITVRLSNLGADLLERELPLKAVRTILWAGLVHEDVELTEETVGGWVDQNNLQEVMESFFGLFGGTGVLETGGMTGVVLPKASEVPTEMETEVEEQIQTSTSQEADGSP